MTYSKLLKVKAEQVTLMPAYVKFHQKCCKKIAITE